MSQSNAPALDSIVVGAGVAGVCAALYLRKHGARVAILDPMEPGSGASFGNACIVANTNLRPVFAGLTPASLLGMFRNPASPLNVIWAKFPGLVPWFLRMLRHAAPAEVERITCALASLCHPGAELYAALLAEAGAADLMRHCGSLALCRSQEACDHHWEAGLVLLRQLGVPMEKLDRKGIDALAPAVGKAYTHAVYSPAYRHTPDPQLFVRALFDRFVALGGVTVARHVDGLLLEKGRVGGVRTASGALAARSVVIAAGTNSARFARMAGESVPHQAVGGYHVMLQDPGVPLETPLLPLDFRFAITPLGVGIRLAGIYEFGGADAPFDPTMTARMLTHIDAVLPGVRVEKRTTWRGFRSYLPDGLPVIGPSQRVAGLFYDFGFSSSGMINGAAAGQALAASIAGDKPPIDLAPFSIARFVGAYSRVIPTANAA